MASQYGNRQYFAGGIFILIGLIYILRLFYVQVIDKTYQDSAENNSRRHMVQYPGRGLIYDRTGKDLLVYNSAAYDLRIIPRQVRSFDTLLLCEILHIEKEELISRIQEAKSYSVYKQSTILKQISSRTYANLQEHLYKFPGFTAQRRTVRMYPREIAAHVLGFVGEVDENEIEADSYYNQGDYAGKTGIEKNYEPVLRGKKGVKIYLVDVHNRIQGSYKDGAADKKAVAGLDIISTLDTKLQEYGEKLMHNKKGSIVAIEPSTGEILTLVSSPSYDPKLLVGRQRTKNFKKLSQDTLKPLFNRAAMASYPPGSTFKLINALIGLEEKVITPKTKFICRNGYHVGSFTVGCHHWRSFDLVGSIQYSCNAYYCNVIRRILDDAKFNNVRDGYIQWKQHVNSFGLGKRLHTDLTNELKGIVPTAAYFDKKYGGPNTWTSLMLVSMGIGQAELGVTPVQMANMAATIANKGHFYTPHLVKNIKGGPPIDKRFTQRQYTTIDSTYFTPIIDGMEQVVLAGTATTARSPGIDICGKTGTAENPHGEDHSIFIAFAPKDDPVIAISVYVENAGFGSTWAAPIASLMIRKYIIGTTQDNYLSRYWENRILQADLIFSNNDSIQTNTNN